MTLLVAAVAAPLRLLGFGSDGASVGGAGSGGAGTSASPGIAGASHAPVATALPGHTPVPTGAARSSGGGQVIGTVSDFAFTEARIFDVPASAGAQFAGDPGILVKLADGTFVAYDAVCTHEGCEVGYSSTSNLIVCPCHRARFDPANQAQVVGGPARRPLPQFPITVDAATGEIRLAG